MPSIKMKTHKGTKKRFKVTANGKVTHKRCGSSHLNSHKSGSQIRKLRKKSTIKIGAEARRLRHAMQAREDQLGLSNETARPRPSPSRQAAEAAALGGLRGSRGPLGLIHPLRVQRKSDRCVRKAARPATGGRSGSSSGPRGSSAAVAAC